MATEAYEWGGGTDAPDEITNEKLNQTTTHFTERIDANSGESFAQDDSTTAGLTWGYKAGRINTSSGPVQVVAGTVVLTPSTTNYVEVNSAGVVAVSATRTSTKKPIRKLVTDGTGIVSGAANNVDERVDFDFTIPTDTEAVQDIVGAMATDSSTIDANYNDGAGTLTHTVINGSLTDTHVAAANKDGVAGTASMRTLGTGAQQAAAGNHTHDDRYYTESEVDTALADKADLVSGKIPTSQIPAVSIGETFVVASQAAMLALTAQINDIAVRTDVSSNRFLLLGTDPTVLANWKNVDLVGTSGVDSINGQTGVVVLGHTDVGASATVHNHDAGDINAGTLNIAHIDDDAVTNAKLSNMAANTIKGNNTGSSADPTDLSIADTQAMLSGARVNAQTGTTYTLVPDDNGKVITLDNASSITLTAPSGLGAGFNCLLIQTGAGQVALSASGTTINNRQSHTKIAGQKGMASLVAPTADTFYFGGDTAT